jgi:hypothetical protein
VRVPSVWWFIANLYLRNAGMLNDGHKKSKTFLHLQHKKEPFPPNPTTNARKNEATKKRPRLHMLTDAFHQGGVPW